MNLKVIFLLIGIIVLASGALIVKNKNQFKPNNGAAQTSQPQDTSSPMAVDINAAFAIYTNGTFRIFSASMYHNLSEDVFIESKNPNIVQVKKKGVTWGNFFGTLPMKLTSECLTTGTGQTFCSGQGPTLKFYLNGQQVENFLSMEIHQNDRALISFGNENETQIKLQLQRADTILR